MSQDEPQPHWVSIRHLQHFLAQAEVADLDGERLLDDLGLCRARLNDAEATVPLDTLEPVLENLTQTWPERAIGLTLAANVQAATFGLLGFLTQSAPRLADVLTLLMRYNGLLSDIGQFRLQPGPGHMRLIWECQAGSPLLRRHAREYILGSLAVLARNILPPHASFPLAVAFPHPPPAKPAQRQEYQQIFRCPVYFDQPVAALSIDNELLDVPLRHGDPVIRQALETRADDLLRRRQRSPPLAHEVTRLIAAMLGEHDPSAGKVARQLGIGKRSLHRRLHAEGTGFQALLTQTRLARAHTLLHESCLPLDDIAARLGLQSRQTLIRWFRQHTGQTPGRYRQALHRKRTAP